MVEEKAGPTPGLSIAPVQISDIQRQRVIVGQDSGLENVKGCVGYGQGLGFCPFPAMHGELLQGCPRLVKVGFAHASHLTRRPHPAAGS